MVKALSAAISILAVAGTVALIDTSDDTETASRATKRRMARRQRRNGGKYKCRK